MNHTVKPTTQPSPTETLAPDCRHYRGDRPCIHNRLCQGCTHYAPYSHRVCVIKLGALGDVIRTLCILPELRERFPNAHVTWVSKPNGCRMIAGHPMLDRVMPFDAITAMTLQHEQFDTVINLDKEPQPCALAMSLRARNKLGVGLSPSGTPVPLNEQARDYFHLGLSDELKFHRNNKSYPRLIYEALGWVYQGQRYELPLDRSARDRMRFHLAASGWRANSPTLGINVGAGHVFANKMWPAPRITNLIRLIRTRIPELQVVLLGGPDERPVMNAILARLRSQGCDNGVIGSGTDHNESEFVALVDACDVVFSGDTMAMHVAIALGKAAVVFFGPTCEQEIDLFGNGRKLVAEARCAPCYKRHCDQNDTCVDQIDPCDAADAIESLVKQTSQTGMEIKRLPLPMAG
jgi:ADP-heptose:LPS heptosyltransferase